MRPTIARCRPAAHAIAELTTVACVVVQDAQVRHTLATEGDEFMLAVPGISGQLVRTGRGDRARVTATQIGDVQVARLELDFSAAAEAVATGEWLIVATMLNATSPGAWEGVPLTAGQSFVYPPGTRHHAADPAGLDFVMTVVPQASFEAAAATLGLDTGPAETQRTLVGGPLWATAQRLAAPSDHSGGGLDPSTDEDALLESVVRTVCAQRPIPNDQRDRWDDADLVGDATSLIDRHDGWVVPMITLCRHVGVSERRLQLAFARLLGVSPHSYMRHRALQAAHRALRGATPGSVRVAEVARNHGFGHIGRFASFYASVYEELPSATLGRR